MPAPLIAILAENDSTIRSEVRRHLADLGLTVLQCIDGPEVVQCASNHRIAIVLMSVQLRGFDGYEACVRIRRLDNFQEVPILLMYSEPPLPGLSEKVKARVFAAAQCAGATSIVKKPISTFQLASLLQRYVSGQADVPARRRDLLQPMDGAAELAVRVWQPAGRTSVSRDAVTNLATGLEALAVLRANDARRAPAGEAPQPGAMRPMPITPSGRGR